MDTDTLSLWQRGNEAVLRRLQSQDMSNVFTTVITAQEQINGRFLIIQKANSASALTLAYKEFAATLRSLQAVPVEGFSEAAILRFESLVKMKLNVGKNDLRIAAIVLEADGVVVTRNRRDFGRVPGLRIEDWSQAG